VDRETITVEVRASIQNGNASLSERFEVSSASLEETLALLARFHQLAEQIRDEQAGLPARRVRGVGCRKHGGGDPDAACSCPVRTSEREGG
jgi:hypothetical protein